MSGLFGCWHRDGAAADAAAAARCVVQLSPHGQPGSVLTRGPIALGSKRSAKPSFVDGSRFHAPDTACVFVGRLDNRAELLRALFPHAAIDPACGDDALVAAVYDAFGDAFAARLRGEFSVALFDRRANRLLLVRDRLGLRPLCYAQAGATFLFASDAKAVLAHPAVSCAPDETALADFLLYFRAADASTRTFFRGIASLPPAHLLIATTAGVTVRQYFDFDTRRAIRLPSFAAYAEAFHELFVGAVRTRVRSPRPVAVSVSGGLDSSYIFAVAQRLIDEDSDLCPAVIGHNQAGASGTPSDERSFVDALESACAAPIARHPHRAGFLSRAAIDVRAGESPMIDALAAQTDAMLGEIARSGAERVLTGHWGDQVLSDSRYLVDLARAGQWRLLQRHARAWRVGARDLAGRVLRDAAVRHLPSAVRSAARLARDRTSAVWADPWFTASFRARLRERDRGPRYSAPAAGSRHAAGIYTESRLPYHVQCMEWNCRLAAAHGLDITFPYLDEDLVQFLMSIPGDVQSHDGDARGLMRAAMRGSVPEAIATRRSKGEFTELANQSVLQDFEAIRDLLGADARAVELGILDADSLRANLERCRAEITAADDAALANRIVDLCGLELFLRAFLSPAGAQPTAASAVDLVSC